MNTKNTVNTNRHVFLRTLFGLVLGVSCASTSQTENAQAACGWGIQADIDGGYAPCGKGKSPDGAFKSELITDGDQGYFKITLNNYHGGSILYECYGTCNTSVKITKTVVELIGDNVISAPDGVGIKVSSPMEFTGQGRLEITAMLPVSGGYLCYWLSHPPTQEERSICSFEVVDKDTAEKIKEALNVQTIIITPGTIAENPINPSQEQPGQDADGTPPESEGSNEAEEKCPDPAPATQAPDSGWTAWDIAATIYISASLLAFICLIIREFTKHKKVSTPEVTTQPTVGNNTDRPDDAQKML